MDRKPAELRLGEPTTVQIVPKWRASCPTNGLPSPALIIAIPLMILPTLRQQRIQQAPSTSFSISRTHPTSRPEPHLTLHSITLIVDVAFGPV